jgi:hypothetical protein
MGLFALNDEGIRFGRQIIDPADHLVTIGCGALDFETCNVQDIAGNCRIVLELDALGVAILREQPEVDHHSDPGAVLWVSQTQARDLGSAGAKPRDEDRCGE